MPIAAAAPVPGLVVEAVLAALELASAFELESAFELVSAVLSASEDSSAWLSASLSEVLSSSEVTSLESAVLSEVLSLLSSSSPIVNIALSFTPFACLAPGAAVTTTVY